MSHTVIGIFDSTTEARNAVDLLLSSGLTRNNIDLCSENTMANQTSSSSNYDKDNRFGKFFGSLLDKDEEVQNYSHVASKGCVVTVHAQSAQEAQIAVDVLDRAGAVDVDERALQYRSATNTGAVDNTASLPVIEEELQVGKRVVNTGGVRIRSRVIERPVEEHLRLREEHVYVDRNPVNKPASVADIDAFQEGVIELREQAEVPVVAKETRVVEEVRLTKEVEERDEVIRDTVRHTEVDVENMAGTTGTTDTDTFGTSTVGANAQNLSSGALDTDSDYLDKSHSGWKSALHRMKEVESDYKVADDDTDVRGWDVVDARGNKIGDVNELIVDTEAMKVRYLEVDVDRSLLNTATSNDHHILIPIGSATLDHSNKNVLVSTLDTNSLANYPAYTGETITRDYEHGLLSALSPGYKTGSVSNDRFYEGEHFDTGRFYGSKKL